MLLEAIMDPNPESQQQQRQVSHHQQQPQPGTSAADADDEDVPEPALEPVGSGSVLFDRVHRMMEKFATTRIGQYVLERGDRVLRTIEDTVKWSLPQGIIVLMKNERARNNKKIYILFYNYQIKQLGLWYVLCRGYPFLC